MLILWARRQPRRPAAPARARTSSGTTSTTTNDIITITWDDVGFYDQNTTNVNAFQLQLIDLGSGEWTVRFIYEDINWTAGQASGSDASGLGGTTATAGFTAGNGTDFYELPVSGTESSMLDLDVDDGNQGDQAIWEWTGSSDTILDLAISSSSVDEIATDGTVVWRPELAHRRWRRHFQPR